MKQLGVCLMIAFCLGLTLSAEAATATWNPNPEPDVLGYVLAYGTKSGVYTTEINVGKRLSYEFFSPPGYRYYVVVRAYSALKVGPNSSEVMLDLTTTTSNPLPTTEPSSDEGAEPSTVGVAADFDGDGRLDPGVYHRDTGKWQLFLSSSPFGASVSIVWGAARDVPVPADYDGDRRADLAIYRPSLGMWYVLLSSSKMQSQLQVRWGDSTAQPMAFDYDGDGRADIAILSSGRLLILFSSSQWKTAAMLK
jgi:hypothetical protein